MDVLDESLNESDLFCKTLIQKRKATENSNHKSKQLKLNFIPTSNKINKEEQTKGLSGGNLKENKLQDWNSKCNESQSSYFSMKESINTCPLCLKSFKTDSAYSGHMKQCAKTHKMTTQQLLGALELQKKQMQERRNLGLSSQIKLPQKKSATKQKVEKDKESYDLALGLALSESLTTDEAKTSALAEAPKSTLKEFGFTSSSAGFIGPSKRKYERNKKSLLRERTAEDRQRIIVEKVAVVLLGEDKLENVEKEMPNPKSSLQNAQAAHLWSRGENNFKSGWYVHGIKKFVLLNENNEVAPESVPHNLENEIAKLNLPQRDISNDWRKLINNKRLSDLVGRTRDVQDVHLHSVVLYARCPELLEKDCKSIFEKYDLSTVLIFIEYLYCGTLNGLLRAEIDCLFNLAREFDYEELIEILTRLKDNLSSDCFSNASPDVKQKEDKQEVPVIENKVELSRDKDLVIVDEDPVAAQQGSEDEGNGDSSNTDKSYWSFIQQQKKMEGLGSLENEEVNAQLEEEKTNLKSPRETDKMNEVRRQSDDSTTKDWNELFGDKKTTFSDCVIISSGSETKSEENFIKSQRLRSRTPSPVRLDYEAPLYDPFENFHCFTEVSPVEMHSQSLISGDVSMESLKESPKKFGDGQGEPKTVGYCSTPVTTVRVSPEVDDSTKHSGPKSRKRRCEPSSSRLIRKSLGLRRRNSKPSSGKKNRKAKKSLAEALTKSVLNELSRCSALESSPLTGRGFIEITPMSNREEFGDCVTPSPHYSSMEETRLKEQLAKYGLKKNLAKSKAKKILRLIYEELHPLYNTETGKIVKMLPGSASKDAKKSKAKSEKEKNGKKKQSKSDSPGKKTKRSSDSCRETENMSDESVLSLDRSSNCSSGESDFESLNETLTQSTTTNPVDLPSAFCELLQNSPEYHQKILLFEPIWIEELQKKLKENFKKHFKLSDLMDFLDQKCITFRSAAQARRLQKRHEKKENSRKRKIPLKGNSS